MSGSWRMILAAAVFALFMLEVVVWTLPDEEAGAATTKIVQVTPPGCERFVRAADAFVDVTDDLLGTQNKGLDAVINDDAATLEIVVQDMTRLSERFDTVTKKYSDARANCL